jgi:hypothetical protein
MGTKAQFWNLGTETDDVQGGPARVLAAPYATSTYPELISEVLDLDTYLPVAPWVDLGHTSEPFESTHGFDTAEWISQQQGRINTQVTQWNRTVTVTFMEGRNDDMMDIVHSLDNRDSNADGDSRVYGWDRSDTTEYRLAALNLQENRADGRNITMDVFPKVKRSGADSTFAWSREDAQTHSVELTPFPDPQTPFEANWYRLQQL